MINSKKRWEISAQPVCLSVSLSLDLYRWKSIACTISGGIARGKRRRNETNETKKLLLYIPWTRATATPAETTSFRVLIAMRRRRIEWFLLLIRRYIRWSRLLLTAWSVTFENRWVFLIRLACAHNLSGECNAFERNALRRGVLLDGGICFALFRLDRQYRLWIGKGCRWLTRSAPDRAL